MVLLLLVGCFYFGALCLPTVAARLPPLLPSSHDDGGMKVPPSRSSTFGSMKAAASGSRHAASLDDRASNPDQSGVFTPIEFGADPTAVVDSTASLQQAISSAFRWTVPDPTNGSKPTHNSVVDLQGGTYLINNTLWLGQGLTFRMCCGALLASEAFPDAAFMISTGGATEGVTIHDVSFDLNRRGTGAIHTSGTLRVHLDRLFVHHYVRYGIQAVQGHEVHVSNCWLGEWAWAESGGRESQNLTGVAIEVDGQDHWLSEIIIFSGKQGIVLRGGALVLSNTHIYNGGTGSALELAGSHAVRVLGSYFDFNRVVIKGPAVAVDISHNMFLGGVGVELQSTQSNETIDGLTMMANQFVVGKGSAGARDPSGRWLPFVLNESAGAFGQASNTMIDHNVFPAATYGNFTGQRFRSMGTTATATIQSEGSKKFVVDFADKLVFRQIDSVAYTLEVADGFPQAALRPTDQGSMEVRVDTSEPLMGKLTITATQGI
jgi:hypothetical protein|eukprot:COSAG01_NODE_4476_length_4987_cov_1.727143_5_plen_490_part_00